MLSVAYLADVDTAISAVEICFTLVEDDMGRREWMLWGWGQGVGNEVGLIGLLAGMKSVLIH